MPPELQVEALREGEKMLELQLTVANAADARALAWSGFLLTGGTASLGGGIALFNKSPADIWLGYVAILFGLQLLIAAWLSLSTVAPKRFCLPGNQPSSWLPENWECVGDDPAKIRRSRIDQARDIDNSIVKNMAAAETNAKRMHRSFKWGFISVVAAGVLLLLTVTYRQFTIQEPNSEFVGRNP
ncbi:hypothetical protein ACMC5O_001848 [Sphingomonas sediminicola]|uniref:hypothetical protein n=1 Tax=Sphingomonas sediminicola TaxID=386874 RepID=UPI003CEA15E4